jgi:hypothetical protein
MEEKRKCKFNKRGFTTLVITVSFIILVASGIILYFTPTGRVVRLSGWTMLGLDKFQWAMVHTSVSILFLAAAVVHLYFNWRIFLRHLKTRIEEGFTLGRELVAAVIIGVLVVAFTIWQIPPFDSVQDFHDDIRQYWEKNTGLGQPRHTEELDLQEIARQVGVTRDEIVEALRANGLQLADENATVDQIARQNGILPQAVTEAVYLQFGKTVHTHTGRGEGARGTGGGAGEGRGAGGGRGLGRMTLGELCTQQGLDLDQAISTLKAHGVQANRASTLGVMARSIGVKASDLIEIIQKSR